MAKTTIEPQRGLTFEDLWAAVVRTDEYIDRMTERMEASNKKWGDLSTSIGSLTEVLIAARLREKFDGHPYNLKGAYLNVQIFDDDCEQVGEIDILLSNTNWVMPVFHGLLPIYA